MLVWVSVGLGQSLLGSVLVWVSVCLCQCWFMSVYVCVSVGLGQWLFGSVLLVSVLPVQDFWSAISWKPAIQLHS